MDGDQKKFIRSIVRRVHPDLFGSHPYERARNAESLKTLNTYVDQLKRNERVEPGRIEFWVKENGQLTRIDADLPGYGSLGSLFYSFGLITVEELQEGLGTYDQGADSRNFLEWLVETVNEAIVTADQHELLKRNIRELRASIEDRFLLSSIHVGGEFAVGFSEQQRQIEALKVFDNCLTTLSLNDPYKFEGLNIRLYHPDSCPFDTSRFMDAYGPLDMQAPTMASYVGDDGCLHVVADRSTISESVSGLDLERARLLTRLSMFWVRRVRELTPALKDLLGIENVWCDTRTEQSSQKFVLWAGYLLEAKKEFQQVLQGRKFSFSILVHSDTSAPLVDFLSSSSVLQVRSDCPPRRLLEFLCSESGDAAHQSAEAIASTKEQEEQMLNAVREALGAKHVIRVCSSYDQDKVLAACQRLLDNAALIRMSVDLSGASIAIDDCYELWESGFISIPYDFNVQDLQPKLKKLLAAGGALSPGDNEVEEVGLSVVGQAWEYTYGDHDMAVNLEDLGFEDVEVEIASPSTRTPGNGNGSDNGYSSADYAGAALPGSSQRVNGVKSTTRGVETQAQRRRHHGRPRQFHHTARVPWWGPSLPRSAVQPRSAITHKPTIMRL